MPAKYGVIKRDPSIQKNRDGTGNVIMVQVEIEDPEDLQEAEFMFPPGQTLLPQKEDRVLLISISDSYKIAVASNDGIVPTGNPGDRRYYSTSKDGESATIMQAFIEFLTTGKITIQATDGSDPSTALGNIVLNNDGSVTMISTSASGTTKTTIAQKNDGKLQIDTDSDITINCGNDVTVNADNNIIVDGGNDVTIDSGNNIEVTAGVTLKLTGTPNIELNGNTDTLVSWTDLNIALQAFISLLNTAFTFKQDAVLQTNPNLTLDISAANVVTVQVP